MTFAAEPSSWSTKEIAIFALVIFFAISFVLDFVIRQLFSGLHQIPPKVPHLEKLTTKDLLFININRATTPLFFYHFLVFVWSHCPWSPSDLTLSNTLLSFISLFTLYDFVYTLYHRLLHHRAIYALIHKHHHRQHAPFRGNLDAVNVHPFEFITGEYLHLLVLAVVPTHAFTALIFLVSSGILASLNHTRYDARIPFVFSKRPELYATAYHDIHHRDLNWNYGQYTVWWDYLFGTFRAQ
eukprot:c14685_g1_i2.p1 GENE.c14685_g1_i2~~c14685_g1_i2.p1  ORF type:complete len:262 (+),score=37.71 c14685_g1_i2:67-786(+)